MRLNVMAGRSYNDITQYPVLPWVIADYTSSTLDLNDPATFRDLSKPIGALNKERLKAFLERHDAFEDPTIPKFLYGSHYSSAGIVLHYLVRQEPFTSLHINLQGGRFDCPDRLFFDINQSWIGCLTSMSDVKELVPEFYCCPEAFLNQNEYPLGNLQDGRGAVGDVKLPPWAKTAHDFVRMNRLALESEHVSNQLHKWIDLVFGASQRGPAAIKANNTFFYMTYEGAVDVDAIDDPLQRRATEAQIAHFGQTPSLLFDEPHPERLPPDVCMLPCFTKPEGVKVFQLPRAPGEGGEGRVVCVRCTAERVVLVYQDLTIASYAWSTFPTETGLPFSIALEKTKKLLCAPLGVRDDVNRPITASSYGLCSCSAGPGVPGDLLLSCGYWDQTIKAHSIGEGYRMLYSSSRGHLGPMTCLDVGVQQHSDSITTSHLGGSSSSGSSDGSNSSVLVTGGADATLRVWIIGNDTVAAALANLKAKESRLSSGRLSSSQGQLSSSLPFEGTATASVTGIGAPNSARWEVIHPIHVLHGHDSSVTCVALSTSLGIVVSGGSDGTICWHRYAQGRFVRHVCLSQSQRSYSKAEGSSGSSSGNSSSGADAMPLEASLIALSVHGDVCVYSNTDQSLHSISLNGFFKAATQAASSVNGLTVALDGEMAIGGLENGTVTLWDLHSLAVIRTIDLGGNSPVTCLELAPKEQYLMAGRADGSVAVLTDVQAKLNIMFKALDKAYLGLT
ncbi:unnamed protein product [Chrysoparadoxa australica]